MYKKMPIIIVLAVPFSVLAKYQPELENLKMQPSEALSINACVQISDYFGQQCLSPSSD